MDSAHAVMAPAATVEMDTMLRDELLDRRERLEKAKTLSFDPSFSQLLTEVDAALQRFENGTFGLCEVCHDPIEPERLLNDPLMRVCLGDLTEKQRHRLEDDLELAAEIQKALLPRKDLALDPWKVDYVYEPANIISGDYCDFIFENDSLHFILGDVSGKGMAASLLMSNLHAMFHSMIPLGLSLPELMTRANRIFCESTLANQYATLVYGKMSQNGEVEITNAGHLPPIVIKNGVKGELNFAGLPLGMFCDTNFETSTVKLGKGDSLVLFTDGVTETLDGNGQEFGSQRLFDALDCIEHHRMIPNCLEQITKFRGNAERHDDLTMLAIAYA
jgi:phosphoserine phosphatase RsbU/P